MFSLKVKLSVSQVFPVSPMSPIMSSVSLGYPVSPFYFANFKFKIVTIESQI